MKPQSVYVEIPVSERLPDADESNEGYSIEVFALSDRGQVLTGCFGLHTRKFYKHNEKTAWFVTHWLEKQEDKYVLSEKDLKKVYEDGMAVSRQHHPVYFQDWLKQQQDK